MLEIFLSTSRIYGFIPGSADIGLGLLDEVWRDRLARGQNCMPSTTDSSFPAGKRRSSTSDNGLLADAISMASAMILPMDSSGVARDGAYLSNGFGISARLGQRLDLANDSGSCLVGTRGF